MIFSENSSRTTFASARVAMTSTMMMKKARDQANLPERPVLYRAPLRWVRVSSSMLRA
jgi:hypothetical protein